MNWSDGNRKFDEVLRILISEDIAEYPLVCPICKCQSVNFYLLKRDGRESGGCWIWCSECYNFLHSTVSIPKWWSNCDQISLDKLSAKPIELEKSKIIIANHVKMLLEKDYY